VINYLRDTAAAEALLAEMPGNGHILEQGDVSKPEECQRIIKNVADRFFRLDVLVNNSAIYISAPLLTSSFEDWTRAWQETLAVNVMGPACLTWCAGQLMAKGGGGAMVAVSSRGAKRGEPDAVAYGASKAALNSMCQSLAVSLGSANIMVAAVAPGFVATEMAEVALQGPGGDAIRAQSPFARVADPNEVARVVLFLAEKESQWLSGSVVDLNGASYLH
jgi:NAD(P)-dependent dehydrogenase (short-subunit alcohol dehydrogenase family)